MKQNKSNRVKQNLLFRFLAQLGEQHSYKMKVIGSSPVESIKRDTAYWLCSNSLK